MEIPSRFHSIKKQVSLKDEKPADIEHQKSNDKKESDGRLDVEQAESDKSDIEQDESEELLEESSEVVQETPATRPIVYFISGGFGGLCSVVTGHPFDTIKVKLQTMPKPKKGRPPMYTGTIDCAIKIIKKNGLAGFYKGMSVPITAITPVFAVCFFSFGLGKSIQEAITGNPVISPFQVFLAGSFAGVFTTFIITPVERIKLLLQIQEATSLGAFSGPLDACVKLYKRGGIRNLYKGTVTTLMRDIPATGIYFVTYESLTKYMAVADDDHPLKMSKIILAGGISGMVNWGVGMPADMLKSKLQSAPDGVYPNGFRDVIKELYKDAGILAFFKGIIPVMLRAFPSNAACFAGFEMSRNVLNNILKT